MIFGMSTATYTLIHVVISLIGIGSGLVVLFGLIAGKYLKGWTALFLVSTLATSVTGFGFPIEKLLPSHKVGILSIAVLAVAFLALARKLAGAWRWIYVICAAIALYFNVFVLVFQAFEKVPALNAMAPTLSEAPFLVAQLSVLALFIVLTIFAVKNFRKTASTAPSSTASAAR